MLTKRAIPCLLLKGEGLVKTVQFRSPKYVGDPINAVKLFNDLEVDELCFLDISQDRQQRGPDYEKLAALAGEAFMPLAYGGGVSTLAQARRLFQLGIEKVVVTTAALQRPEFITELAEEFGRQSVVVGLDVKRNWFRAPRLHGQSGRLTSTWTPEDFAAEAARLGAGELLLNSIDRDGTQRGYDLSIIASVCNAVAIPVIACGGAGSLHDLRLATDAGASGAAAGSLFVFKGKHRAVMINYPARSELNELFSPPK